MLTGKLSDFTGIFVLAVVLQQFFPGKKAVIYTGITLFFMYWKSPLAQPLIDWCNYSLSLPVTRVVDYTDLIALVMLVPAYYLQPVHYQGTFPSLWLKLPVLAFTFLAIAATSMPMRQLYTYPNNYVYVHESFKTKLSRESMLHRLDSLRISYHVDSVEFLPAITSNYFLQYQPAGDSVNRLLSLDKLKDSAVLYRRQQDPYYVIPSLVLEKDTITNVQFRINEEGRKRSVSLLALTVPRNIQYSYYESKPLIKKYKALFKSILTE